MILVAIDQLAPLVGRRQACHVLAVPRATWYRHRRPPQVRHRGKPHPRALRAEERTRILACLHEERFQDCAPRQVYAALLDEGRYHCSVRTMYRLLDAQGESRERRDQLVHPPYQKPELLATGPNQLWSWDITKLRGPAKWVYYYLYVVLDVFSRYVVGWMSIIGMRKMGAGHGQGQQNQNNEPEFYFHHSAPERRPTSPPSRILKPHRVGRPGLPVRSRPSAVK